MPGLNVKEQMEKGKHLGDRIREHTESMVMLSQVQRDEVIKKLDVLVDEFVDYVEEQSRRLQKIKEALKRC